MGNGIEICLQGTLCAAPLTPFITGAPTVSGTLTGQLISNVMFQWIRDVTDIPGATSQTYELTSDDVGHLIRVRMYFTDADNNFITVTSKPVGPVQGSPANPVVFQALDGNGGSSPVAVTMPAGVSSGDLLLSTALTPGVNAVFSISAGWTILDQVSDAALSAAVAYRLATGSGDQPTWSWTGGGTAALNAMRFTGNSITTPIGNHSVNNGSGTTMTATPITSAGGGTFNLNMLTANPQTIPVPGGWSDLHVGIGGNFGERVSALDVATAGTSSGTPAVIISSSAWIAFLVELRSQ